MLSKWLVADLKRNKVFSGRWTNFFFFYQSIKFYSNLIIRLHQSLSDMIAGKVDLSECRAGEERKKWKKNSTICENIFSPRGETRDSSGYFRKRPGWRKRQKLSRISRATSQKHKVRVFSSQESFVRIMSNRSLQLATDEISKTRATLQETWRESFLLDEG